MTFEQISANMSNKINANREYINTLKEKYSITEDIEWKITKPAMSNITIFKLVAEDLPAEISNYYNQLYQESLK